MDPQRARELLEREEHRVRRALAGLQEREGIEELSRLDQHPADYATELFDEELGEGMRERLTEELEAIERAKQRLEEGTYGLSVESGEPIPDGRLEAIPWAERTAEEQERFERAR
jgi:RNA polymerase-binding transcription factor DksA